MQSRTLSIILWATIALALIGFTDSAFLLSKRLSDAPIPCFITSGCDAVSKSPHSVLFGVPLALWGVIFYLGIGFLALLCITSASGPRHSASSLFFAKLLTVATTLGFLSSLYFIYVQKFLIGAFCIYCIFSALVSTVLFALGLVVWQKLKIKK